MAIAFLSSSNGTGGSSAVSSIGTGAPSQTIPVGSTVVIAVAIRTTTVTVSSVTDTQGNTYVIVTSVNNSTSVRGELWQCASTTHSLSTSDTWTVNLTGGTSKASACVSCFSGVGQMGANTTATPSAANPSISITTQDANNWVVGGFAGQNTNAFSGAQLRTQALTSGGGGTSNCGCGIGDNTAASPSSVSVSVTNADTVWANCAVELRTALPFSPDEDYWEPVPPAPVDPNISVW